jgi:nucleotide-binding universal stress UspA family protein
MEGGAGAVARPATPVIMVAVDTTHPDDPRQPALQNATRRLVSLYAEIRLLCVSVVPAAADGTEEAGQHLDHMARLRRWTVPLGLPPDRLSLHVLRGDARASAILELARENHVDLLVLGAPGPQQHGLAWWRSVASSVAASAPCSVHLVRLPAAERSGGAVDARPTGPGTRAAANGEEGPGPK